MPPPEPRPSDAFLMRLDTIAARLEETVARLAEFVRKDVYDADQRGLGREIREIRNDIEELQRARRDDQSWRRSTSVTIAIAGIGWLLTIVIAVATLVVR